MSRWLGVLVLVVAVTIFAVQNDEAVRVAFLGWHTARAHLAVALALAFFAGAAVTALVGWPAWWRERRARRQAEARYAEPGAAQPGPEAGRSVDAPGNDPVAPAGPDAVTSPATSDDAVGNRDRG